jgi:hypothetical protein
MRTSGAIILYPKLLLISLVYLVKPCTSLAQVFSYEQTVRQYIGKYKDIAILEMMVYRIPASITLAQGILESNAGTSPLATQANNHFGIKCHKEWQGKTFTKDDETKHECFRKYENPIESFRDHSFFLTQRGRYKSLFNLDISDYKGWAYGLKAAGYATNTKYPEELIKSIETYELFRYDVVDYSLEFEDSLRSSIDTLSINNKLVQVEVVQDGPGYRKILTNNGLNYIIAHKDDNIKSLAKEFGLSIRQLYEYNDMKKGTYLISGQMVYLENKRRKGAASFHIVRKGETMYTISQKNGIQLKILYKKNKMKPGQVPKPGKKLVLR